MKLSEIQKKIKEIDDQQELNNKIAAVNRARSISVGTAFGGITEISMRREDGQTTYSILQPVEVIELIHQLCANVGCNVALKPRKDFASWRDWRVSEEERERLNGWFPFVNDMSPYNQLGANGMDPDLLKALDAGAQLIQRKGQEPGRVDLANPQRMSAQDQKPGEAIFEREFAGTCGHDGQPGQSTFDLEGFKRSKKNAMAIEKPKNRRSVKRAAKAS